MFSAKVLKEGGGGVENDIVLNQYLQIVWVTLFLPCFLVIFKSLLVTEGIYLVIIREWTPLSYSVVVLVNRELSDGSVNWPLVRRRYLL